MRILIISILVIFGITLQTTWLHLLQLPGNIIPDIVLVTVICYGLLRGPDEGLLFGLAAGLFLDLLSGGIIGIQALSKMGAGFIAGFMEKNIFKDSLLVPVIAVSIGTLVCESFNLIMYTAFKVNLQPFSVIGSMILPLSLLNTMIAPLIYQLLLRMERYLAERGI